MIHIAFGKSLGKLLGDFAILLYWVDHLFVTFFSATLSSAVRANLVPATRCGNAAWKFFPTRLRRVPPQIVSPPHPPPLTRLWAVSFQIVSPVSPGLSQSRHAPESRPPPRRCLLPPCDAARAAIPCPAPSKRFRSRSCWRRTGR